MKYQVGQKVKYDSGDWWFYGTVTAVIENAICPCYRINVEWMEKKECKFSISQFEFDLTTEMPPMLLPEPVVVLPAPKPIVVIPEPEPVTKKRRGRKPKAAPEQQALDLTMEMPPTLQPKPILEPKVVKPKPVKIPVSQASQKPKRKNSNKEETWNRNFENYVAGVKNHAIYTWASQNRRMYQSNALSKNQIDKLEEINFQFELRKHPKRIIVEEEDHKKNFYMSDAWWDHKISQWKKGGNSFMHQWQHKCEKLYQSGKLSDVRVAKLKELGILQ